MKKKHYHIFSYGGIAAFFIYWLTVLLVSMPSNRVKQRIANNFPRFKYIFTSPWNLFSPPNLNQKRVYYIVKDSFQASKTDTIEVMEKLLLQKQQSAPFNQKENIIDHSLYYNAQGLISAVWQHKKKPAGVVYNKEDSAYIALSIKEAELDPKYIRCLGTLQNYCKIVLKENEIDTTRKLVKMMISEKMMPPFKELKNPQFVPAETIVFETPYLPVRP